jgi:hypothetical protein
MFDVEGRSLERLMHAAILAARLGAQEHLLNKIFPTCHAGFFPSKSRARARTKEIVSLNSASASNSARCSEVKRPSLFRSMRCCKRWSVFSGKRSAATASSKSGGGFLFSPIVRLGRYSACDYNKQAFCSQRDSPRWHCLTPAACAGAGAPAPGCRRSCRRKCRGRRGGRRRGCRRACSPPRPADRRRR